MAKYLTIIVNVVKIDAEVLNFLVSLRNIFFASQYI